MSTDVWSTKNLTGPFYTKIRRDCPVIRTHFAVGREVRYKRRKERGGAQLEKSKKLCCYIEKGFFFPFFFEECLTFQALGMYRWSPSRETHTLKCFVYGHALFVAVEGPKNRHRRSEKETQTLSPCSQNNFA